MIVCESCLVELLSLVICDGRSDQRLVLECSGLVEALLGLDLVLDDQLVLQKLKASVLVKAAHAVQRSGRLRAGSGSTLRHI